MGVSPIFGLRGKRTIASKLIFSAIPIISNNQLSPDQQLENKYYEDPNGCDLSELKVVKNVISGRKDIVTLFWENKLGVDVEVCILLFKQFAVVNP